MNLFEGGSPGFMPKELEPRTCQGRLARGSRNKSTLQFDTTDLEFLGKKVNLKSP